MVFALERIKQRFLVPICRAHSGTGEIRWLVVPPGETVPFTFEEPGKLRHMNSHDMKIHQVCDGERWELQAVWFFLAVWHGPLVTS